MRYHKKYFSRAIDITSILMYRRYVIENKWQANNQREIAKLAPCLVGLREGSRLSILGARSRGFNSPLVQQFNAPLVVLTTHGTCPRITAKDRVVTPAVILAYRSEESKGQNDVPQLQGQVREVW